MTRMSRKFNFHKISDIDADNPLSWGSDTLFLTFDIDWAHDDVIRDCQLLLDEASVCTTFFITHDTPVIDELRANARFELAIHPNFNHLLDGTSKEYSAEQVIQSLKSIVPEATSVRSHSTTFSSQLCSLFVRYGLTHDSNFFVPDFSGINLKPWRNWLGMTMVPYLWEDDVAFSDDSVNNVLSLVKQEGLRVFDFHPIHVFLNSESPDRYNKTRALHQKPEELIKYRYEGYGTRSRLIELLELSKKL